LHEVLKFTPENKLYEINQSIAEISYTAGEVIYNIGHDTSAFYFIKDGAVLLETLIEIDSYFQIPVSSKEWEVRKQTKKISYRIANVYRGGWFGHEEIL
jgi:hypothetical protein